MSKQVLDIQQMQHLKELGVDTSKASMCHVKFDGENEFSNLLPNNQELFEMLLVVKYIPSFTLQDILDLLPNVITAEPLIHTFSLFIDYQHKEIHYACVHKGGYTNLNPVFAIQDNLIDAAYEMLCWCVENGYVETKK